MESNQTKVPHFFSSILVKMILIGGIILVLLIPALLIQDLIQERESLKTEAELDIQDKWGGSQVLTGPFLTVPYYMIVETEGRPVRKTAYLQILPETLSIKGRVEPQIRYRGIYKVVIYQVQLDMQG